MRLAGRVLVVTGAGDGIGQRVVLELLARGASVAAVSRTAEHLEATAALAGAGGRLSLHPLDVRDRAGVLALPAAVLAAHGAVDGLVNVAGVIQPFLRFADLPFEEIERVIDVNLWGTIHTVKAFLPLLLAREEAAIANVASLGGLVPVPGQAAYGASKAAVALLTEGLAAELRDTGVRVTLVLPGATHTRILENSGVAAPGGRTMADSPFRLTSAARAARRIIDAVARGEARVRIGTDTRLADWLRRLAPTTTVGIVARRARVLLE